VVNNRYYFIQNSVYHDSNTTHRNDLHLPHATLAMYQKGVYYSGIEVFNGLPRALNVISSEPSKFKIALRKFLQTRSLYSLDEFFLTNSDIPWCISHCPTYLLVFTETYFM